MRVVVVPVVVSLLVPGAVSTRRSAPRLPSHHPNAFEGGRAEFCVCVPPPGQGRQASKWKGLGSRQAGLEVEGPRQGGVDTSGSIGV